MVFVCVVHTVLIQIILVRENTSIPVPKVLDWSDDPTNSTGTEYIIMEHAPGVQLHEIWPQMDTVQHMRCVKSLTVPIKELNDLNVPAYGSIYFDNSFIDNSHRFPLTGDFFIGPHCSSRYFACYPGQQDSYSRRPPNQGPCMSSSTQNLMPYLFSHCRASQRKHSKNSDRAWSTLASLACPTRPHMEELISAA